MSGRRLLIDAGNSRLKWAVSEGGQWRDQGNNDYADLSGFIQRLAPGIDCIIASVARATHERQLAALLGASGIVPRWLMAEAGFADVKNTYMDPRQLGVDRWMGLIAARQRTRSPVLVVSVGTAMTVDALAADGIFLGGLIVPGVSLMQQALQQGTARVAASAGACCAFPRNTADAVQSGIVAALCGAIQHQYAHLADVAGAPPHCLLTGGDAEKVLPHLKISVEHVPMLVLEGIDRVAREGLPR
ncbi:type III pantothenate kinase [Thiobacillus denitrificans]|uniref:type III pantothenate kinase n=1 Tax=Thiobacillus denitrificans TaxID=36861 RepID=UPI00036E738C|nr:type III pantothenate kinase [Thiobacillus denitrificans]